MIIENSLRISSLDKRKKPKSIWAINEQESHLQSELLEMKKLESKLVQKVERKNHITPQQITESNFFREANLLKKIEPKKFNQTFPSHSFSDFS